jgi:hypothetical protein
MSAIERLLVPGSTELPACHCGDEMRIASLDPAPESSDAHIRIYKCPSCAREMRLTVWRLTQRRNDGTRSAAAGPSVGLTG